MGWTNLSTVYTTGGSVFMRIAYDFVCTFFVSLADDAARMCSDIPSTEVSVVLSTLCIVLKILLVKANAELYFSIAVDIRILLRQLFYFFCFIHYFVCFKNRSFSTCNYVTASCPRAGAPKKHPCCAKVSTLYFIPSVS